MNFFTLDFKKILVVIALLGVPLIAINMQRNSEETLWFARPFYLVAGVAQDAFSSFSSGVRGTTALYLDLVNVKKENRLLLTENLELRAQLGALTELKLENERLNTLLNFRQRTRMQLLAAKVISKDLVHDQATITINRGTQHGLVKKMAAITVGGVVGYISLAGTYTSQVLLLTDRYAVIDAIVQRSRVRGLIEGHKDLCRLSYLQMTDDVKEGDLVVTSGLHGIFPKGFPIGTVTAVKKSRTEINQEVELKPIVNPQSLEEVFIVLNSGNEDFTPKEETSASPTSANGAPDKNAKPSKGL